MEIPQEIFNVIADAIMPAINSINESSFELIPASRALDVLRYINSRDTFAFIAGKTALNIITDTPLRVADIFVSNDALTRITLEYFGSVEMINRNLLVFTFDNEDKLPIQLFHATAERPMCPQRFGLTSGMLVDVHNFAIVLDGYGRSHILSLSKNTPTLLSRVMQRKVSCVPKLGDDDCMSFFREVTPLLLSGWKLDPIPLTNIRKYSELTTRDTECCVCRINFDENDAIVYHETTNGVNHIFHLNCACGIVSHSHSLACPLCREEIELKRS